MQVFLHVSAFFLYQGNKNIFQRLSFSPHEISQSQQRTKVGVIGVMANESLYINKYHSPNKYKSYKKNFKFEANLEYFFIPFASGFQLLENEQELERFTP